MSTTKKISPLIDFTFKKLFGVDESKDILIDLINAVVSKEDQLADLEIKNPYNAQNFKNDKLSILDIKARGVNKKWYVIEMQILDQNYFDARALYYWSRVYHTQLANGINYDCLEKTISINFLNFNCLDEENYHNTYKLTNQKSGNLYPNDHVELHFIELRKYQQDSFTSTLDKWTNFLVKAYEYDAKHLPKELQIAGIKKATALLEEMSLTPEERENYESRLKWMLGEEMALKKAKENGFKKGVKEGIKEGIKKSQMDTAKKLKEMGLSAKDIAKATNLTIQQIEKI